jgi:biopolymer transport protein ExbB/TolQ
MDLITNSLYWISTGLLVPVIILLLIFFVWSLIMGGSFYGQYLSRRKENKELKQKLQAANVKNFIAGDYSDKELTRDPFLRSISQMMQKDVDTPLMHKLIGDFEIAADKDMGKSKMLARLGPMFGLMGTLIPMGPALVGLASGDVASMASNMQVAFATTVVGIFTGAVGFITLQVKQRWYADDMNTLDYISETFEKEQSKEK